MYLRPGRIRTPDLFNIYEGDRLSIESTTYIWWYNIHHIPTCGGMYVQEVLIFHTVVLALQPVAAGLQILGIKRGEQVESSSELVRCEGVRL
jgi:hypothetical protein